MIARSRSFTPLKFPWRIRFAVIFENQRWIIAAAEVLDQMRLRIMGPQDLVPLQELRRLHTRRKPSVAVPCDSQVPDNRTSISVSR
jgi:hypothetical protein